MYCIDTQRYWYAFAYNCPPPPQGVGVVFLHSPEVVDDLLYIGGLKIVGKLESEKIILDGGEGASA